MHVKQLFLVILILLFFLPGVYAEEDYKRLYLEQKAQSLRIELQAIQMRFNQIQTELPQVLTELREYTEIVEKETGNEESEQEIDTDEGK